MPHAAASETARAASGNVRPTEAAIDFSLVYFRKQYSTFRTQKKTKPIEPKHDSTGIRATGIGPDAGMEKTLNKRNRSSTSAVAVCVSMETKKVDENNHIKH